MRRAWGVEESGGGGGECAGSSLRGPGSVGCRLRGIFEGFGGGELGGAWGTSVPLCARNWVVVVAWRVLGCGVDSRGLCASLGEFQSGVCSALWVAWADYRACSVEWVGCGRYFCVGGSLGGICGYGARDTKGSWGEGGVRGRGCGPRGCVAVELFQGAVTWGGGAEREVFGSGASRLCREGWVGRERSWAAVWALLTLGRGGA
uniref:Uncharacterized protein n=1 Tax=Knipowitschia caucasica TaxID=637954 RepID=A0AAV2MK38_KNICA